MTTRYSQDIQSTHQIDLFDTSANNDTSAASAEMWCDCLPQERHVTLMLPMQRCDGQLQNNATL